MADVAELYVGITWVLAVILGVGGCGAGSLSLMLSSWMVSDMVTSGLYYRCLDFPGNTGCAEISGPNTLQLVQAFMIAMLVCGGLGSLSNVASQFFRSRLLRMLAGGVLLAAGMVGLLSVALYTVNFTLCAGSSYGTGFVMGWSGAIAQLLGSTSTFLSAFRYFPERVRKYG